MQRFSTISCLLSSYGVLNKKIIRYYKAIKGFQLGFS
jgi:hypothetical protein